MAVSKQFFKKTLFYFVVTTLISGASVESQEDNDYEKLPFCDQHNSQDKKLVLVSTLDGKLSALNAENGGVMLWNVVTGPGPMLSSSIHRLELTSKGHWVRMIPSLSGHIYKFDGESLEAVPVNADQLLKNSFRYSEDLVISGGRETRTYGVDASTGRILYECTMRGCDNLTSEMTDGHVLVVKRDSQTIRAIEPRTGTERWNYSVAQHEVKVAGNPDAECHDHNKSLDDLQIKIIVPEGLVCALSKKDPHKILWQYKFDTPVVHAWQYNKGDIEALDLFSGSLVPPWSGTVNAPSLYIGMHQKQLYIQESVTIQRGVEDESAPLLESKGEPLKIPWKPYPAASNAIGWPESNDVPQLTSESDKSDSSTTALSVLYASEYVNGNGFYLFKKEEKDHTCSDNETVVHEEPEQSEETPVQVIIVSLWYWWKEVIIISITTAILLNLFFTQRFLSAIQRQETHQPILILHTKQGSDSGMDGGNAITCNGDSSSNNSPQFSSRYLDDFEQVRCLGRGGFGVVFEARKKIDDCSYAVKRIQLPFRKESRERVMREVKALAKLEHPHIVRYYHSWLECPPPGWQEDQDKSWQRELQSRDSLLCNGETYDDDSSESSDSKHKHSLLPYYNKDVTLNIPSDDRSLRNATGSELSDSLIQFKEASKENSKQVVSVTLPSCETESESMTSEDSSSSPAKLKTHSVFLYIQMQLCQKESLQEWLQRRNKDFPVKTDESLNVFHQITLAVEYVHLQGLIHRDLKPSNIFFSMDGFIKVGDFGLVTDSVGSLENDPGQRTPCDDVTWPSEAQLQQKHTANVGTKLYMSPEQMHGLPYDHKVDIYSLGIILFELLWPFSTQMERADTLQAIREKNFPNEFLHNFRLVSSLLESMLSHMPHERPSAQEIKQKLPQATQLSPL